MNTTETHQALGRAEAELERVRLDVANGRADRAAFEAAEWSFKEARIRHDEAERSRKEEEASRAAADRAQQESRLSELRAFVCAGYATRFAPRAKRIAAKIVELHEAISALDAFGDEVYQAAIEANTIAASLGASNEKAEERLLDQARRNGGNATLALLHQAIRRELERSGGSGAVVAFRLRLAHGTFTSVLKVD